MGLTCHCGGDYEWYYFGPKDYCRYDRKRRKRCYSCRSLISTGDVCTEFQCFRNPRNDIEERIHGDEVPMASDFMCERCSDLYFSFEELGFCITLGDDMRDLLRDYRSMRAVSTNTDVKG